MKLTYSSIEKRFIFDCEYDERLIAKDAGFLWDPRKKHWYSTFASVAEGLREYADKFAKDRMPDRKRERSKSGSTTEKPFKYPF